MTQDPYRYFRVEAPELLEQLAQGVLEMERRPADRDLVARLLRLAHTLKGAARVVGQHPIAELAHHVEDLLAPHRDGTEPVSHDQVDDLLRDTDQIAESLAGLNRPAPDDAADGRARPAAAARPAGGPDWTVFPEPGTVAADIADLDRLLGGIGAIYSQLGSVEGRLDDLRTAREQAEILARRGAGGTSPSDARLVELGSRLAAVERDVALRLGEAGRELRVTRERVEQLRLSPVHGMLAALHRTARDVADDQGKRVRLCCRGGEVRLDARVLAAVGPALVQLVRNAVAHGIEPAAERLAAGKEPEGRVDVEVARRARRAVFRCVDDGRGFDLAAIRRAAQRTGVMAADAAALDQRQLIDLLLAGGISTSSTVTGAAGRGVGLDVVREATRRLGGTVSVRTEAGRGATVELTVPFAVAAVDGLLVEGGDSVVALPLDRVRCAARLSAGDITRGPHGEVALLEGEPLPFITLSRLMAAGAAAPARTPAGLTSSVVVDGEHGPAQLGVDGLRGVASLVVSPLPELTPAAEYVYGMWADADGQPRLVLDPDGLPTREPAPAGPATAGGPRPPPVLLVVDDSLTTRMLEQSILESAGYAVHLAVSGEQAMELAGSRRYDMFLVDVEMPGMDGFQFIERVRADPALCGTPSILVTSRSSAADRVRGDAVGARGYLVKSEFDQNALLALIADLLAEDAGG